MAQSMPAVRVSFAVRFVVTEISPIVLKKKEVYAVKMVRISRMLMKMEKLKFVRRLMSVKYLQNHIIRLTEKPVPVVVHIQPAVKGVVPKMSAVIRKKVLMPVVRVVRKSVNVTIKGSVVF